QIKNAFGRIAERSVPVTRPKADLSPGGVTTIQVEQDPDGTVRGVVPGLNAPPRPRRDNAPTPARPTFRPVQPPLPPGQPGAGGPQ
ncbi:MAG TPA: hypothetical protein PKD61_24010, partial [Polyangiaceae bacterium]|nr:hypothetical protein [Polyangiaceae bacterium]